MKSAQIDESCMHDKMSFMEQLRKKDLSLMMSILATHCADTGASLHNNVLVPKKLPAFEWNGRLHISDNFSF